MVSNRKYLYFYFISFIALVINVFKNTIPQENQIQNITPSNYDGFMSFTFDDFKTFEINLNEFNSKDSLSNNTELFNDIIEIGIIYDDDKRAIVLNSILLIYYNMWSSSGTTI